LDQVLDEYKGQVRLVFRNFPLTSIHPYAQKAAEAAECAGEQGKFWEMHDKLFENQGALTVENLKSYAQSLGLSTSKFNDCLDSSKYAQKINQQATEAQAAGVTGTPATFVGSQLIKGAVPYENFKALIENQLK
ncbi:MAG: thioredoxin domain-containing protein, partial [Candidatus Komeilibacteria bacterium]|nr:thioredoxin domain-containing protein [Candidatus Komeilibacteria bacterium]